MAATESGLRSRMDGNTRIRPAQHIQQTVQDASSLADIVQETKKNEQHELQAHENSRLKKHYFQDLSATEAASFQASAEALAYAN